MKLIFEIIQINSSWNYAYRHNKFIDNHFMLHFLLKYVLFMIKSPIKYVKISLFNDVNIETYYFLSDKLFYQNMKRHNIKL